jgi:hypothetical protein
MVAGVKTGDYTVAYKLIKGWKAGKLTDKEVKLMKLAYKHNIVSGGFLFDAKGTYQFEKSTKTENLAKFIADNDLIKKARVKGEHWDDVTRLANFVNGMDKFGSVEQAAKQVRTYLFNYNELTGADRAMRTIVPFWNWMKRNIPLQVKLLMEVPKFAQNNERFRDLFNDGKKGADWQKETGIKIPNMNRYMSIPSPVNDLPSTIENPSQLVGSTNPAIKMMLETMMNKKFYTNKPISYGSDTIKPEDIIPYIASNLGIGGDMYKLGSGESSPLEFLANLFKSTTKINPKGGS